MKDFRLLTSFAGYGFARIPDFINQLQYHVDGVLDYLHKSGQGEKTIKLTILDIKPDNFMALEKVWFDRKRVDENVLRYDGVEAHYPNKAILYFHPQKAEEANA